MTYTGFSWFSSRSLDRSSSRAVSYTHLDVYKRQVVNWFDALVIDRLWVGHSKIWRIKGMDGVPYVKPWKTILMKRSLATLMYLFVALAAAGIVVLIGKLCF